MTKVCFSNLAWIPAAALLGFAIAAVFAGLLRLPRGLYLVAYVALAAPFLVAYTRWSGLAIGNILKHNWYWGVIGAILVGVWTVRNVLSQPASPRPEGISLGFDLLWSGVVYGLVDSLLLSILPVLATYQAFTGLGWTASWPGKILVGCIAIVASLFVTSAYHLGYPEFRGRELFGPVVGNGAMTLGTLLAGNPITAVFSHIAMHIAGVLHGAASVVQLPPH